MRCVIACFATILLAAAGAKPPPPPPPLYHNVSTETVKIPGTISGFDPTVVVYYPEDAQDAIGTLPLIVFAHGATAGGPAEPAEYAQILKKVSSYGFVIAALESCAAICNVDAYAHDQLHIIDAAKDKAKYPVFLKANTSNVGIFGHSWGAMSTILAAKKAGPEVKAAFSLHPCPCAMGAFSGAFDLCGPLKTKMPLAFFTGTLDTVCIPTGVKSYYEKAQSPVKSIANVNGITHFNPTDADPKGDLEGPYVGNFFNCWLAKDSAGCNAMYGTQSNSLCKEYSMHECESTYKPQQ